MIQDSLRELQIIESLGPWVRSLNRSSSPILVLLRTEYVTLPTFNNLELHHLYNFKPVRHFVVRMRFH